MQLSTSIEKMNEYKTYRNRLNHVLRNAEKSYYRDLLRQNMYNLTNTWKILNGIIDKKVKSNDHSVFKYNNKTINDPDEIANKFNDIFYKYW